WAAAKPADRAAASIAAPVTAARRRLSKANMKLTPVQVFGSGPDQPEYGIFLLGERFGGSVDITGPPSYLSFVLASTTVFGRFFMTRRDRDDHPGRFLPAWHLRIERTFDGQSWRYSPQNLRLFERQARTGVSLPCGRDQCAR